MELNEQDRDVIRLLSKLKEAESNYPVEMMALRRQGFVKQIAALGLGTGAAIGLSKGARAAGGSSVPPIAGTIVETILIVAIVAEAGFVAIMNRDKVLDLFQRISGQPTVQQVTASPDASLPAPAEILETEFIETAIPTLEPTMVTETAIVVETPSPAMLLATEPSLSSSANDSEAQVNSTPAPNGDNGNHYGQTPRAERTKDSGSGGGGSSDRNSENQDSRRNR